MRRRDTLEAPETLNPEDREKDVDNGDQEENNREKEGFFSCYLLVSLNPRFKGHTYIGFTVNPRRRIRQHNGEIGCGAWRTKRRRPWEMVLCIYGFRTNVSALQFEWAWQHPLESLAVRKAAASFKSLSGVANKVKLAYTMLTLPSWNSINFTVNFFSTKYTKHAAGCPSLPENMKVQICCMDELPCYVDRIDSLFDDDDEYKYEDEHDGSSGVHDNEFEATLDEITSCSTNQNKMDVKHATSSLIKECQVRESSGFEMTGGREQFEFVVKDKNLYLRTESSCRFSQQDLENSESLNAARTAQLLNRSFTVPCELEVIDLSTPSSSCGRFSKIKKTRVSSASSNLIDLTRSPTFVQL